jgi:hypothetical protein
MTYVVDEETEEENDDMVQVYEEKLVDKKVTEITKEYKTKVIELEAKVTELETKVTDLETEKTEFEIKVTEFEAKITDLEAEKTELSEFKANIVEQDKTNKVNYAIETVKDSLNDEQITEWKAKVDEFENIEAFTNAIQAFAFTQVKQIATDEIQRIHIPQSNKEQEKKGLWD